MEATVVAGEHANLVVTHSPCAGCKKLEEHAEVGGRRICKNPRGKRCSCIGYYGSKAVRNAILLQTKKISAKDPFRRSLVFRLWHVWPGIGARQEEG